ncbi:unnamed protein product, partial [Prorocentrum cordatum]
PYVLRGYLFTEVAPFTLHDCIMSLPVSFTAPRAATEASDDTESRVGGQFGVSSLADTMAEIDGEVAPLTCGFRVHLKKPLPPNADAMERLALVVSDGLVKKARAENNGRTIYGTLLDELQYDAFQEEAACLGRVEKEEASQHAEQRAFDARFRAQRQAEAAAVLLPDRATPVIEALAALRGDGGSERSKRRFADCGMEVLATGQRVAASSNKRARQSLEE